MLPIRKEETERSHEDGDLVVFSLFSKQFLLASLGGGGKEKVSCVDVTTNRRTVLKNDRKIRYRRKLVRIVFENTQTWEYRRSCRFR